MSVDPLTAAREALAPIPEHWTIWCECGLYRRQSNTPPVDLVITNPCRECGSTAVDVTHVPDVPRSVVDVEHLRAALAEVDRLTGINADLIEDLGRQHGLLRTHAAEVDRLTQARNAAIDALAMAQEREREMVIARGIAAAEVARLTSENQRLRDLVRHQRGPLHEAGLLTDEEYAALAADSGAVARLEGYDAMRAEIATLTARIADLEPFARFAAIRRIG